MSITREQADTLTDLILQVRARTLEANEALRKDTEANLALSTYLLEAIDAPDTPTRPFVGTVDEPERVKVTAADRVIQDLERQLAGLYLTPEQALKIIRLAMIWQRKPSE